jgi:hypothetical protein
LEIAREDEYFNLKIYLVNVSFNKVSAENTRNEREGKLLKMAIGDFSYFGWRAHEFSESWEILHRLLWMTPVSGSPHDGRDMTTLQFSLSLFSVCLLADIPDWFSMSKQTNPVVC